VWLLLAVPTLIVWLVFVEPVVRGTQRADVELEHRIQVLFADVGAVEGELRLVLSPQLRVPAILFRATPAVVVIAAGFVRDAREQQLRGMAALKLAELRDPSMSAAAGRIKKLETVVTVLLAIAAAVIAPAGTRVLAALAPAGLAYWGSYTAIAMFCAIRSSAEACAVLDGAAAALAGAAAVAEALVAMRAWQERQREARPPVGRVIDRLASPVRVDGHQAERAAALGGWSPR
jgi:hypothetical protein